MSIEGVAANLLNIPTWPLTGECLAPIFNQMVKYSTESLDAVFSALGDPTRRAILAQLAEGETRVTELAEPHRMSLPAISKHLRVLESAGLVTKQKAGRVVRCSLNADPLKDAAEWVGHYRRFWEGQFDRLERYLEDVSPKPEENTDD